MNTAAPPSLSRALLWPTLLSLLMLPVLLALGFWQMERLAWKEALLARLEARRTLPVTDWPADLPSAGTLQAAAEGATRNTLAPPLRARLEALEFRVVRVTCRPDLARAIALSGQSAAGTPGWVHVAPCQPVSGAPLLVDLGWTPPGVTTLPPGAAANSVILRGPLKPASTVLDRMTQAHADVDPVPLVLVAGAVLPGLAPSRIPRVSDLPNNHFQYAMTWFGLAATLAGVYAAYAWSVRRRLRA